MTLRVGSLYRLSKILFPFLHIYLLLRKFIGNFILKFLEEKRIKLLKLSIESRYQSKQTYFVLLSPLVYFFSEFLFST